jgi:O-antigen ligase
MLEKLAEPPVRLLSIVRYAYYAFIFSIPIETLDIGLERGVFSLSKLVGILFLSTALLQPQVCFKKPPRPFWYFLAYILICAVLATFQPPQYFGLATNELSTLVLMLMLFWVSYNLLQDKSMVKGAFLSMIGSCALLAGLVLFGFTENIGQGRLTTMSQNANALGSTLSLGLLTLLGLAYGREDIDRRIRLLLWICFGGIAAGIVATGSRASMLGLMAGIILLMTRRGRFSLKVQVGFVALLAIATLVWISYENKAVRIRWERALLQGDQSRREEIHPEAWSMFTEKPFFGWGPISHNVELGARFGRRELDTHNLYLWIMTETGLLGAVPFFIGLWICLRAAWMARYGTEGSLPVALLACLLIVNMAGSLQYKKLFWIVLAYSLASESFLSKRWRVAHPAGSIEKTPHPVGYSLRQP